MSGGRSRSGLGWSQVTQLEQLQGRGITEACMAKNYFLMERVPKRLSRLRGMFLLPAGFLSFKLNWPRCRFVADSVSFVEPFQEMAAPGDRRLTSRGRVGTGRLETRLEAGSGRR